MISPLKTMTVTGAFGEPAVPGTGLPDSSGVKRHIYRSFKYLSYLEPFGLIQAPRFGKSDSGITNIFTGLLSTNPIHIKSSTSSLLPPDIKDHHLVSGFVLCLYKLTTFKSTLRPLYQKSKGVLCDLEGLSAPYFSINQFSQAIPGCGLPLKTLCLGLVRLIYDALLLQSSEQYFKRPPCILLDSSSHSGMSAKQNSHFINTLYSYGSLKSMCREAV